MKIKKNSDLKLTNPWYSIFGAVQIEKDANMIGCSAVWRADQLLELSQRRTQGSSQFDDDAWDSVRAHPDSVETLPEKMQWHFHDRPVIHV